MPCEGSSGSFSALRRLNIVLPPGTTKTQALAFVTQKYAGQARAGTTESQRFSATLVNTEEIIGAKLLPTVNRYLTELGDWLSKMAESGRLQKDVNLVVGAAGDFFKTLGAAIKAVDTVTGSFVHTLEILLAIKMASIINRSWVPALSGLAAQFGLVEKAAVGATAAETTAGKAPRARVHQHGSTHQRFMGRWS
jgi:hypothetical protein